LFVSRRVTLCAAEQGVLEFAAASHGNVGADAATCAILAAAGLGGAAGVALRFDTADWDPLPESPLHPASEIAVASKTESSPNLLDIMPPPINSSIECASINFVL
jgi:hypothetical protein